MDNGITCYFHQISSELSPSEVMTKVLRLVFSKIVNIQHTARAVRLLFFGRHPSGNILHSAYAKEVVLKSTRIEIHPSMLAGA
jgi:hypothetical protein